MSATALSDPPSDVHAPVRGPSIRQRPSVQPPRHATVVSRPPLQTSDAAAQLLASGLKRDAVNARLALQFMGGVTRRQPLGMVLAVAMALLCWWSVSAWGLVTWTAAAIGAVVVQQLAASRYLASYASAPTALRERFLKRMSWLYVAAALVWASSPLLFLDRVGEAREFACWAVLGAMVNTASHRLALVPLLHRAFTNTFYATAFAFFAAAVALPSTGDHQTVLFAPICVFQFWLSRRVSRDVYRTQKELYATKYDVELRRDQAEAEVKEKNKFLAAATHDMRQPVIAMGLYAEFLESDPTSHEVLVPKINRAAAAVNALFNSLFDVTSLDSGHHQLKLEPVSLAELLATLRIDFEPLASARQVELRMRGTDVVLISDGARLRRMVGNVVSNAIKYSKPEGKVLVAIRRTGGVVAIEVWDQGVGIPAAQIDKVFAEFYRAEGGRELAPDGMGIGLSLVRRLADALGSTVTITSCEGRGTKVTITVVDHDRRAKRSDRSQRP